MASKTQDNDPDFEVRGEQGPELSPLPTKAKVGGGTKLERDGKTVTAHKPTTVTRLKSEGWKVVKA